MSALNKTMQERDMQKVNAKQRVAKVFLKILTYLFLTVMALVVIFPFYWMILSSLQHIDVFRRANSFFPWQFKIEFDNYAEAFNAVDLHWLFLRTACVGVISTLLSLVITVLSAFAFARLEFKGKNLLFGALLATMMIPGELFTITNYETVMRRLNWTGNMAYLSLVIPFLVSVFYIYLLRQNFMQIPNELYLAAKVDGTSDIKYLWKVMIPLSYPTLISITILKMMGAWNTYKWPELVASHIPLITNGIRKGNFGPEGYVDVPVQMAAVFVVSIPLFLVFIFLRKYIMKGVSRSGIKG